LSKEEERKTNLKVVQDWEPVHDSIWGYPLAPAQKVPELRCLSGLLAHADVLLVMDSRLKMVRTPLARPTSSSAPPT